MKYSEFKGQLNSWSLDEWQLNKINLIVGKNASGKTRTLNIINGVGSILSGNVTNPYVSGSHNLSFIDEEDKKTIDLEISYENNIVVNEKLIINSEEKIIRNPDGSGEIFAEAENKKIRFQIPQKQLVINSRRDSIQHSYLEYLFKWGSSVQFYPFGTSLGKDAMIISDNISPQFVNPRDINQVIPIFVAGRKEFGQKYTEKVINDMKIVGYNLSNIDSGLNPKMTFGVNQSLISLLAKEKDLQSPTFQTDMSSGMFRVLSLLIQVNYSQLKQLYSCILIDDIGEGLDYERSTNLIGLLIDKAKESNIQLIMSSNDRFVMNNVPLEHWVVLQRTGSNCKVYSKLNSPEIFSQFEFTGLSNFDFLASEFYLKGMSKK
jgi:energy-coupling factor transporter ATP-binding protein EcfA2